MTTEQRIRVFKMLLFPACLLPFALLLHGAITDQLGANPIETITRQSGEWTLRLLLITLAVTPVRRLSGWRWPQRVRRMLGLFVFFYASVHLLSWAWLDQQLDFATMLHDIVKRPYVTLGFAAWLLLLPLALTSNRWSMRRLGRRWVQLHKAVYLIGVLGVLHFLWLVKADLLEPVIYALVLAVLLALRWRWKRQPGVHMHASAQGKPE